VPPALSKLHLFYSLKTIRESSHAETHIAEC